MEGEIPMSRFIQEYFNLLIDDLNFALERLSFFSNFRSEYLEDIEIPASSTARFSHGLGEIPKSRLILRQTGGGLITDGDFTTNYIELVNNGASEATISVVLFRE